MGKYTKEERTHVRKNVYAFKISNADEFIIFYWHGFADTNVFKDSDLDALYITIMNLEFIQQYYICKKVASENNFGFEEFGEKSWKNINKVP